MCGERDGERDDFQGNGKSLREGNTREKQSKEEMHLPDKSNSSCPTASQVMSYPEANLQVRRSEEREKVNQSGTSLLFYTKFNTHCGSSIL